MPTINVPAAKKHFHDYLDRERPWNKFENKDNMYALMEELVEKAAFYFAGERKYTSEEYSALERVYLEASEKIDVHPLGYEGPCACRRCCTEL